MVSIRKRVSKKSTRRQRRGKKQRGGNQTRDNSIDKAIQRELQMKDQVGGAAQAEAQQDQEFIDAVFIDHDWLLGKREDSSETTDDEVKEQNKKITTDIKLKVDNIENLLKVKLENLQVVASQTECSSENHVRKAKIFFLRIGVEKVGEGGEKKFLVSDSIHLDHDVSIMKSDGSNDDDKINFKKDILMCYIAGKKHTTLLHKAADTDLFKTIKKITKSKDKKEITEIIKHMTPTLQNWVEVTYRGPKLD